MIYKTGVEWPYPVLYEKETEVDSDILVLGGGIAGCWAAIAAAKRGMKVVLVEKSTTIRSGSGGSGCDHWGPCVNNPCSTVTPDDVVKTPAKGSGMYNFAMSHYIDAKENYDALLELEQMGGKVRDTEDEFKGADFRDDETKFMFAYEYDKRYRLRVWGPTFKPSLYNECKRLGVRIYDRTMATGLLTEGGKQGARCVGATGLNVRTGEFFIFRSKATISCMSKHQRNWNFSTELSGFNTFRPNNIAGAGYAMAWRAGAALTHMEMSKRSMLSSGNTYPFYGTGNPFNSWVPCTMVDADGKEIPWLGRDGNVLSSVSERVNPGDSVRGRKKSDKTVAELLDELATAYRRRPLPDIIPDLEQRIIAGEFKLPLYADLPGMTEHERNVIWGVMVGNEGRTKVPILRTYKESGFDSSRDLLQSYIMLGGGGLYEPSLPQTRIGGELGPGGGFVVDWNLMTTLPGLYAAGDTLPMSHTHSHAATTGRYAARHAVQYAAKASESQIDRAQVEKEKARVYGPVKQKDGIEWKELNVALCRVMQNYCGEVKNEELLNIGLMWLDDIEQNVMPTAYAPNPHILSRTVEVMDILDCNRLILESCLARKACSTQMSFVRLDYPQVDPPDWHKWVTVKQHDDRVIVDSLPLDYWGDLESNYAKHCGL